MTKKVAIIGAGPGGLTAAMILARRGFAVTLFEARDRVGGRNAALELDGFRFDTGPTFLMLKFVLDQMFVEAGRESRNYLAFTRLDPLYRLVFEDRAFHPRAGEEAMRAEIARVFPGEEHGYSRFVAAEHDRFTRLFPCLQKDYSCLTSFLRWPLLRALPHLDIGRSVHDVLGRYFRDERLKLAFTFQAKYLGMSPWNCPGLFTMLSFIEHAFGVYHVRGGLNAISTAMASVAAEHGATVRLNTPVERVILRDGIARGVRLKDGADFEADEVIINADFGHAATTLFEPGALKKYAPARMAKRPYSCSTFMLYLGLDTVYRDLPHHNILFARNYRRNVENIFGPKTLDEDISVYLQNASVTDPTLAPAGMSTLYALVPAPNLDGATDWAAARAALRERVLEIAETRGGFRGLRRHIQAEKITTPGDWYTDHRVYKGATFNLSHQLSQMLYWRPHNQFEEAGNCWLVGGGTHPGSGLPTIYESGRITANLLCAKHGVPFTAPDERIPPAEQTTR
jgi:phytoene desaturase